VASPERLEPCLSDLDSSISPPTNAASRDPAGGTRSVASRIDPNGGTRWCENPFSHRWCGGIVSPAGARIPSRTNVVAAGARILSRTGGVGESFPPGDGGDEGNSTEAARGGGHEGVATEEGGGRVRALSPLRGWSRRRET